MARAGRKRKSIHREQSGRPQRAVAAARADEIKETVVAARQRVFGLKPKDAASELAASAAGRLQLIGGPVKSESGEVLHDPGGIDADQYEAAVRYFQAHARMHEAIHAPRPPLGIIARLSGSAHPADAMEAGSRVELDEDSHAERCTRARETWGALVRRIGVEQGVHRGAKLAHALDRIVLQDVDDRSLVGDLRVALNIVHHFFAGRR